MPAIPKDSTSGSKATDVEWFATDIAPIDDAQNRARQLRVTFAASAADINYEWTIDSGTSWLTLPTVVAEEVVTLIIAVREGDALNLRHRVGATTVRFCRVDEIFGEVA